jgi:hypothetical protein
MTRDTVTQVCASLAPEACQGPHATECAAQRECQAGGGHRAHELDPSAAMMLYGPNVEADIVMKAMQRVQSMFQGSLSPAVLGCVSPAAANDLQQPAPAFLRQLDSTFSSTVAHHPWSHFMDASMPLAAATATTHQPASTSQPAAAACTPRPRRSGALAEGTCCGDSDVVGEATANGKVPSFSHCCTRREFTPIMIGFSALLLGMIANKLLTGAPTCTWPPRV